MRSPILAGPVELLCRCVQAARIDRPKQAGVWSHAAGPLRRRGLVRAAPGDFIRRASSAAARGGRCVPQGRQPKENPPSLFSVEKIWAAIDTGCGSHKPWQGSSQTLVWRDELLRRQAP